MKHALIAILALAPVLPAQASRPSAAFELLPTIATGPMAGRPELADLDHDGDLDVLVPCGTCCGSPAAPDSGHVLALLNDGDGRLSPSPQQRIVVGASARKLAVGDFDGDGHADAAVAQHDLDEIVVLFGDGTGKLEQRAGSVVEAPASDRPHTHDIAAADLDGDGHLDLVTTQADAGRLSVLGGGGDGTFSAIGEGTLPFGLHPYDTVLACDANGDGRADLIAPDLIGNRLVVRVAHGIGFGDATFTTLGTRPVSLAAGDLDGDGHVDLVASHDDVGLLSILQGDGTGGFTAMAGSPIESPRPVIGLTVSDLDGDGDLDLACGTTTGAPVLLANDGGGRLRLARAALPSDATGWYLAAGDLNGDARADLVLTDYVHGTCRVLLATGKGLGEVEDASVAMDWDGAVAAFQRDFAEPQTLTDAWNWVQATQNVERFLAEFEAESVARRHLARVLGAHMRTAPSGRGGIGRRAEELLAASVAADPDGTAARFEYARVLAQWPERFGKRERALETYAAVVRDLEAAGPGPEHATVYACYGMALRDSDRREDAEEVWRRGAEQCGENDLLSRLIRRGW